MTKKVTCMLVLMENSHKIKLSRQLEKVNVLPNDSGTVLVPLFLFQKQLQKEYK